MAEYAVESLLRYGVPSEISAKYAVSLLDSEGNLIAGQSIPKRIRVWSFMPGISGQNNEFEVPVSPVGNGLILRAQAWRTSQDIVGNGFFWMIGALSLLTAWMLIGNWRHTRKRQQTQRELFAETNFRRAMENSILTGMRALDLEGRITYVNLAFCQMTGWQENELIGAVAPYPYWPDEDREFLMARLEEELSGKQTSGGFQVRVKRKNGSVFDARLYVSPLIDANGRSVGVRGCIDNRQMQLRPGMFARVNAVFGERADAMVIPEEAIVPQGGRSFVVKVVPGPNKDELISERVTVKVGLRQPGKVEILEGLSVGDSVVIAGQQRLQKDGTLVRIVDPSKGQTGGPNAAGPAPGNAAAAPGAGKPAEVAQAKGAEKSKPKMPPVAGENPCLRGLNAAR
jgi:PAS domain S-box-containing protein